MGCSRFVIHSLLWAFSNHYGYKIFNMYHIRVCTMLVVAGFELGGEDATHEWMADDSVYLKVKAI